MNRTSISSLGRSFVALVAIGAAACGGSPPPEPAAPPPARPATPPAAQPAAPAPAVNRPDPEAERRETARKREILEQMVFFDYDQSEIRGDARRALDEKVTILRGDAAIRLLIEGHADERGSTEYNLALGSRRANAIRDYFTGFGLAANRFETTTYGEGRPLVDGHNEAAWGRNRRGQFVIRTGLADR